VPAQEREVVHHGLDDHYRCVLDEPIPALGGQTPRAAAKTAKGRGVVMAWLRTLEKHAGRQKPKDPMASYDFDWLWREMGVEALQHWAALAPRSPAPERRTRWSAVSGLMQQDIALLECWRTDRGPCNL
jgi:hypothetical protein